MDFSGKIISLEAAAPFRAQLRQQNKCVVATNGCFDLLHVGHLRYLTEARNRGDFLWVGLNGDASVQELKGPARPLVIEQERAEMLAALRMVDAVTIFPTKRAISFLEAIQPDIYIKGGDYTLETLDPDERAVLDKTGAKLQLVLLVPGRSTSRLVEKIGAIGA